MMTDQTPKLRFEKMTDPSAEIAAVLQRWANDPELVPFMRPSQNQQDQEKPVQITPESLAAQLEDHVIYLVYLEDRLVGEVNYQVDPEHLYHHVPGTAWIGISIGEKSAWGQGIGTRAVRYLEDQIRAAGCRRIELGVFEFNQRAHRLYRKLGYREIGRIDDFTYWKGDMWQDIRMEKHLGD